MSLNAPLLVAFLMHSAAGVPPAEAPAEAPRELPALRLALTDLSVTGIDPQVAGVVNESLLAEMRKLARVSVIGMDEIRAMLDLEAQKQMVGCDAEESCLSEIIDALGADVLVLGSMARVGDQHIFGLRRIDQRSATVTEGVNRSFPAGEGEEFLAAIGPAVEQLFPARPLRPGVTRGVSVELAGRLHPPPLRPWVFWTASGTAGASALLAAAAAGVGALGRAEHQAIAQRSRAEVVDAASLKAQQTLSEAGLTGATALGIGAALAGLAAGVTYFFTDWEPAPESRAEAGAPAPGVSGRPAR